MTTVEDVLKKIQEVTEFLGIELRDVDQRGIFGNTPLKVATVWGDADAVRALLKAGADPNIPGENGDTPLHHAASLGHYDVVRALLDSGASPRVVNDDGHTPEQVAKLLGHQRIEQVLATAK